MVRDISGYIPIPRIYLDILGGLYEKYTLASPFDLRCQSGICISYNTSKSALPDIYAQCPRAHSARGQVHIYQTKHSDECLYMCYN